MTLVEHVKVSDVQKIIHSLRLPEDARLTIIVEGPKKKELDFDKQKALDSMKKLKGLGDESFLETLLEDRKKETLL